MFYRGTERSCYLGMGTFADISTRPFGKINANLNEVTFIWHPYYVVRLKLHLLKADNFIEAFQSLASRLGKPLGGDQLSDLHNPDGVVDHRGTILSSLDRR